MAYNIMDQFKKCCDVVLKTESGLIIHGVQDPVISLPQVEIIQFDMIGVVVDLDGEVYFIPWGSIRYISAGVGESHT